MSSYWTKEELDAKDALRKRVSQSPLGEYADSPEGLADNWQTLLDHCEMGGATVGHTAAQKHKWGQLLRSAMEVRESSDDAEINAQIDSLIASVIAETEGDVEFGEVDDLEATSIDANER